MSTETIKTEARRLLESLPDGATWDDLLRLFSTAPPPGRDPESRPSEAAPRPMGLAQGRGHVPPAFFEPLPDDWLDAFEGEAR
jgi:hypothetical protein